MDAFERTADAADLWAAATKSRPEERVLGLASAVVAAFEVAVEHFDDELLGWLASLKSPATIARTPEIEAATTWSGSEDDALIALRSARAAWDDAHRETPSDGLVLTISTAARVLVHAVVTADEAVLLRVWTRGYGAPVAAGRPYVQAPRERWARIETDEALDALERAANLFTDEAHRQPMNPAVTQVAAVVAAFANAVRREDRLKLAALRETLLDPTPAREVLRVRGLPTGATQRDDFDGDAAIRTVLSASEAWQRAAGVPWASRTTRAAAVISAAVTEAVVRTDVKSLENFVDWAHRYTENKVVMTTHDRSVRAEELANRLVVDLRAYEQREAEGGMPQVTLWATFVAAAVRSVAALLPECFLGSAAPSGVMASMRERLESPQERGRLLALRSRVPRVQGDTAEEAFARAVAVSALKANDHTAGLADNLFTYQRVSRRRKGTG